MDLISVDRAEVPVYAYVFAVWYRGVKEAWNIEGIVAYYKKDLPVSSVGWAWV